MFDIDESVRMLIECEKFIIDDVYRYRAPLPSHALNIKLASPSYPEDRFYLDIHEGRRSSSIALAIDAQKKTKMQSRKSSLPLLRIDLDEDAEHTNPDGTILHGSHVHIASERFNDRAAFPLSSDVGIMVAGEENYVPAIFESFRTFCHIDINLQVDWDLGI